MQQKGFGFSPPRFPTCCLVQTGPCKVFPHAELTQRIEHYIKTNYQQTVGKAQVSMRHCCFVSLQTEQRHWSMKSQLMAVQLAAVTQHTLQMSS